LTHHIGDEEKITLKICSKPTKDGFLCGTPIEDKKCTKEHGSKFNKQCLKALGVNVID